MELMSEIKARYAAKDYQDAPVSRDVIGRIVEAGRLAPSAKNRQTWRFVVIDDPSLRTRLADAAYGQDCVAHAGAIVALCTTNIDYKMPNGQLSYPVDLGIAGAFMMLQATHEGLGSCPVTTFDEAAVCQLLTIPYSMRVVMLLTVGTPVNAQGHRERLPASRLVSFNSW